MIDKIFFDITKVCNGKCKYCFTDSGGVKKQNEFNEIEIVEILKKLKEKGINKISIGGGEPFLKDITKIVGENKDLKISITTNGTILNKNIIQMLEQNKNVKITISLDSLSNKISNKIRDGIDVDIVKRNIVELARNDKIRERISIRTTVSKVNENEIYKIIDFCEENKIPNMKVNTTNKFGRAKENEGLILPFSHFMNLLENILEYCRKNKVKTNVELPIEKYLNKQQECLCGNTSLYIDSQGNVFPCAFSEGNLLIGRTKDGEILEKVLEKKFDHHNEICMKCPVNRYKKYEKKTKAYV